MLYSAFSFPSLCFVLITAHAKPTCDEETGELLSTAVLHKADNYLLQKTTHEKKHKAACGPRYFINSSSLPTLIYKSWRSPLKCPLESPPVFITTHLLQGTWRWHIRGSLLWRWRTMSQHETPLCTPKASSNLPLPRPLIQTSSAWVRQKMHCLEMLVSAFFHPYVWNIGRA